MAIDPEKLLALRLETHQRLTVRDTILYALGVGAAQADPLAEEELQFVYEEGLRALPTMAVVMGYPGFWLKDPAHGVDWRRVLHGEQSLRLFKTLPVEGDIIGVTRVDAIIDKGRDKGALLRSTREIRDAATNDLFAHVSQSTMLRGDGGFGGAADGAPAPHPTPTDRPADQSIDVCTRTDQALLYRLSGDWNPLHADPAVARQGGFDRPILHGLCTYGVVGRAALAVLCGNDPARLKGLDVRFSSPVLPGDTLRVEFWREGSGEAAFRATAVERAVTALQNGLALFEY
jgi:acyl dehydratase